MPQSIQAPEQNIQSESTKRNAATEGSGFKPLARKVLGLGALFLGALRSHPLSTAAVAGGVGAFVLHRQGQSQTPAQSQPKKIGVTSQLSLPNSPETKVMVIDLKVGDPKDPAHSRDVAFVVNSHLDHSQDVRTILYQPGVGLHEGFESLCNLGDIFSELAKAQGRPDVVASSVGMNSSNKLKNAEVEINKFSRSYTGPKPGYPKRDLLVQVNSLTRRMPQAFEVDKNQKCSNGLPVEQHFSESAKKLTDAGTTVVVGTNNAGALYESMKDLGVTNPEVAFDAIGYGKNAPDTPGLIVVGGVGPQTNGKQQPSLFAGPSYTVDVAALSENVPVNSNGQVSSGVSFAVPQIAAVAANMKAINKRLTPAQIEKIIKETATPLPGYENRVGMGAVNPEKAYERARQARSFW